jgi:hypothetical protein
MANNPRRRIHGFFVNIGWLKEVDGSTPLPSTRDMLFGGMAFKLISAILVLTPLYSGTFNGNISDEFVGTFLWLLALIIESLVIYSVSSTIKKKLRLRREHTSDVVTRTN